MKDRPFAGDEAETEELDLGSTNVESIEEAMQEALNAVEGTASDPEAVDPPGPVEAESLESLQAEVKRLRDKSIRTLADFDNFRKRVDRERSDQSRYAGTEILRELLSVIDNLERASEAQGSPEETREGVELILRQLGELLKRHGVQRVSSDGERFDPAAHEAVVRHESDDVAEPTIVKELQSGYWLRERLLRPALVEVAVPNGPSEMTDNSDEPAV
jgi:molecular chaperone GrpE